MKMRKEESTTTNSSVYRKITYSRFKCPFCPPNKGCNAYGKYESDSWKDQSKKRKQWGHE